VKRDRTLEKLRSSLYLSGTCACDFALDTSEEEAAKHWDLFIRTLQEIDRGLREYNTLIRPGEVDSFSAN
jgi:hypothetical protein